MEAAATRHLGDRLATILAHMTRSEKRGARGS
jgi:hypothetical protein